MVAAAPVKRPGKQTDKSLHIAVWR